LDYRAPELSVDSVFERLSGTVSDGSHFEVYVRVDPPDGHRYRLKAAVEDDTWTFMPQWTEAGEYRVWVQAIDVAGNMTTAGPYLIEEIGDDLYPFYLPLMQRRE
jgi:hypothetical protein